MKMRHEELNIEFETFCPRALRNLNEVQQEALAKFFSELSRRLAEVEFLLAAHENGWPIPKIENTYREVEK